MNTPLKYLVPALALSLGFTFAFAQTILISDTFDTAGSLNGSTPGTTVNDATWTALGGPNGATSNGSVLSLPTAAAQTNVIDLGGNYFSANPGIYTLSMDVLLPAGSATGWVGFGFVTNPQTAGSLSSSTSNNGLNPDGGANGGSPWLYLKQDGGVRVMTGPGTTGSVLTSATGLFVSGTTHTLRLVLDTSQDNWTLDAYVDSTQLDLNGATVGSTAIFSSNPDDIRYVGFGVGGVTDIGTTTLDNFTLTYTAIPEPANTAMILGAVAGLGIMTRRKRKVSSPL